MNWQKLIPKFIKIQLKYSIKIIEETASKGKWKITHLILGVIFTSGGGELMKFIISNVVKLSFECKSKNLTKD